MRTSFFLLAGFLFLNGFASTAQTIQLVGPETFTDWSGAGSFIDGIREIRAPGILQAFEIGERQDDPCFLKATFAEPTGPGQSREITRTIDLCDSGPTDRSRKQAGEYSSLGGTPMGVRGFQVCSSMSTNKLKGLRMDIYRMMFDREGMVSTQREFGISAIRTGCDLGRNGWEEARSCPDNQFAVGLRAGVKNDNQIADLQLICRGVEQVPTEIVTRRPTRGGVFRPGGGGAAPQPTGDVGTKFTTVGTSRAAALAGESGTSLAVVSGRPNEVLYGLEFAERSDEPCYIKTFWADASGGRNVVRTRTDEFSGCAGAVGDNEYIGVPNSEIVGTSGPLLGIYKLGVQTNGRSGNNVKVKAVFVVANDYFVTRSSPRYSSFERSNADATTQSSSECGEREQAVGLEIHHNTIGPRKSITGIALRCMGVRSQ